MTKKIVFTGGHHNSALVLAKALQKKDYKIYWFGHKHSSAKDKNLSSEFLDIQKAGIEFINLKSGKIYNGSITQVFKFIKAYFFSLKKLFRLKPDLMISFGGYLSVPAVLAAKSFSIPSISHEQTLSLGLANKFILPFVKKMYTAWPEENYGKNHKIKHVGLPLDPTSFRKNIKLPFDKKKPLLVITGGKQGSHVINMTVKEILPELLKNWNIIHQTGNNSVTQDFQRFQNFKKLLPEHLRSSYHPISYHSNIKTIFSLANLIVGRSGAHTVYELIFLRKKLIAIPYPYSSNQEQKKNAKILENIDLSIIIEQNNLTSENLLKAIKKLNQRTIDQDKIDQFSSSCLVTNATQNMLEEVEKLLS